MEQNPLSVLIVDDSALMRNLISRIIEGTKDLFVGGKAINGDFALQKIPRIKPDVIILDIEMPGMNGIDFLKERKKLGIDIPVIILSSVAKKGAKITMEALNLGASDFVMKPSGAISRDIHLIGDYLTNLIRAYGNQYRKKSQRTRLEIEKKAIDIPKSETKIRKQKTLFIKPEKAPGPIKIIVIGISTGGPSALREIFSNINPELSIPIVIVQHMPAEFTNEFARSLNRISPLEIFEANEGSIIKPGRVLIAPGNQHIEIEKKPLASIVHLNSKPPINGHRPSVDVLFSSTAKAYGKNIMAIIMTGMGKDGAKEIGTIYKKGGLTISQDEESSVVFGMPNVAIKNGFINHIIPLNKMAEKISEYAERYS